MKKTFDFGKINYNGTGRRYPVTVSVELRKRGGEDVFRMENGTRVYTGEKTPVYYEYTASAMIGDRCGGQCLDTIAEHVAELNDPETFGAIYQWWKQYHLNGMHAGTPEQEKAIREWESTRNNRHDYLAVCEMLKEKGLYEVLFTGKTVGRMYNNEPYKYGCGWVVEQIPGADLIRIEHLLSVV